MTGHEARLAARGQGFEATMVDNRHPGGARVGKRQACSRALSSSSSVLRRGPAHPGARQADMSVNPKSLTATAYSLSGSTSLAPTYGVSPAARPSSTTLTPRRFQ
jgi:hypothetical protein